MRDAIKTAFQRLRKQSTDTLRRLKHWAARRVGQLRELAISIWDKLKGVGAGAWKRIKAGISNTVGWLGRRWKDLKGFFVSGSQITYVGLTLGTIALLFIVLGFLTSCLGNSKVTCLLATLEDDFYANLGIEFLSITITVLIIDRLVQIRQGKQEKSDVMFQLGSDKLDVADEAVRKLKARGWLYDETLKGAHLEGANLKGAHLIIANLKGAVLMSANLEGADLEGANLEGANLMNANLEGAHLRRVNLKGVDLWSANLKGTELSGANLEGAVLEDAYLEGSNLTNANLEGADLEGANLEGAHLMNANLEGAHLRGANLKRAELSGANLEGIIYNDDTIWPDGFTPPPSA